MALVHCALTPARRTVRENDPTSSNHDMLGWRSMRLIPSLHSFWRRGTKRAVDPRQSDRTATDPLHRLWSHTQSSAGSVTRADPKGLALFFTSVSSRA